VHRGPYAAFVVTGTSVRPGVMLDQLEQAVIAAEEARAKQKEVTLKVPDAAGAPSGRPRTSLHPPADRPAGAPVGAAAEAEEMPSFAAPTGPVEGGGGGADSAADWSNADPVQLQQMQAMQEQMAAMQAQLQQAQALQQGAPSPAAPAAVPTPIADQGSAQPLSGYRRPESATPPPAEPAAPEVPRTELGGARPSIEGSQYESVLADEQPAPFGSESSPFARLEAEQAQAAAEQQAPPAATERPAPPAAAEPVPPPADASAFRTEPQRLLSPDAAPPAADDQEEPGEVDRVMLAKEFSGLLQLDEDGDED
jgi:hypothetical protein